MNEPHRQITHQLEKTELCLFHDDITQKDLDNARGHILDALDLMKIEHNKLPIPKCTT